MHLVQLLLPLMDQDGKPFPRSQYRKIREVLTERFGGLTAYTRAPAEGLWDEGDQVWFVDHDVIEPDLVAFVPQPLGRRPRISGETAEALGQHLPDLSV